MAKGALQEFEKAWEKPRFRSVTFNFKGVRAGCEQSANTIRINGFQNEAPRISTRAEKTSDALDLHGISTVHVQYAEIPIAKYPGWNSLPQGALFYLKTDREAIEY